MTKKIKKEDTEMFKCVHCGKELPDYFLKVGSEENVFLHDECWRAYSVTKNFEHAHLTNRKECLQDIELDRQFEIRNKYKTKLQRQIKNLRKNNIDLTDILDDIETVLRDCRNAFIDFYYEHTESKTE